MIFINWEDSNLYRCISLYRIGWFLRVRLPSINQILLLSPETKTGPDSLLWMLYIFWNHAFIKEKENLRNNGKKNSKLNIPYHETCSLIYIKVSRRQALEIVCLLKNCNFLNFLYARYSETPCLYDQLCIFPISNSLSSHTRKASTVMKVLNVGRPIYNLIKGA